VRMSKSRVAVEWGFAHITQQFSYVNFQASMRIFKEPIVQYFVVATFLCNIRNCWYGGQTSDYFGVSPRSLHDYLSLVNQNILVLAISYTKEFIVSTSCCFPVC